MYPSDIGLLVLGLTFSTMTKSSRKAQTITQMCQHKLFTSGYKVFYDQENLDVVNGDLQNRPREIHAQGPENDQFEKMDLNTNLKMDLQPLTDPIPDDIVPCCTICGGPLAIKILRETSHPESGRPIYEWTAQMRGLSPWLYRKAYIAISMRRLREDRE